MICNKCGKTLPDDSTFCQFCGSKIETIAVSADETPSVSKEEVLAKVLAAGVIEGRKGSCGRGYRRTKGYGSQQREPTPQ